MQLQHQVYTYYKRKMYKGRSTIARVADFIFLRLFFFTTLYLVFIFSIRVIWLSVFLAATLTVSLSLILHIYNKSKLDRFVQHELGDLKKECLLENIVMMDSAAYRKITKKMLKNLGLAQISANASGYSAFREDIKVFAKAFYQHPSEKVTANDLLNAYKVAGKSDAKEIILLSPSGFTKEAEIFAKRYEGITLVGSEKFLEMAGEAGFAVDDDEATEAAFQAIRQNAVTPEDIRQAALNSSKAKSYMICGIFALAWSYIAGFQFYYPVIALVCFLLAFYIRRKEDLDAAKKRTD